MEKSRLWFEIVSIATTTALALALLLATLGAVAGAFVGQPSVGQSPVQAPLASEDTGMNSSWTSSSVGGIQ